MNKLEANISLIIITFFAAIQYAFLSGVPDTVSHFSFLCITNLIGLAITLALFFSELFRVDKKQIVQSLTMSCLLFGFNIFLLLGTSGVGATVSACVLSAYFIFIPLFAFLLYRQKPVLNSIVGIAVVLLGLFFMLGADISGLFNVNILYLVIADMFFALYILMADKYTQGSNPALLAMGQMLFNFLFALVFWAAESVLYKTPMSLPAEPAFWGSAVFIGFFIRGLYGIVQINAQRYVSPLNTSLIFSTEIVMTMIMSPVLAVLFGGSPEVITPVKIVGAIIMVAGILAADGAIWNAVMKGIKEKKESLPQLLKLILLSVVLYAVVDIPVQTTGYLTFGSFVGIKNFLAPVLGMQLGIFGVIGTVLATLLAAFILNIPMNFAMLECVSNMVIGIGIWLFYNAPNKNRKTQYKNTTDLISYLVILVFLSAISGVLSYLFVEGGAFVSVFAGYISMGILVGIPVNIMIGGIFCLKPIGLSSNGTVYDMEGTITSAPESLLLVNDMIEEAALDKRISRKRLFEVQSCVEELTIRIFNTLPDAQIKIFVDYGDTISMKFSYLGERYNPLLIKKNEDKLDIISLTLVKHRALRATYKYRKNENSIHIVV